MILKIPTTDNEGDTYLDRVSMVMGPRTCKYDKASREFADVNGTVEPGGVLSVMCHADDNNNLKVLYYQRGTDLTHAIIYDDRIYLMNDNGKTIETLY